MIYCHHRGDKVPDQCSGSTSDQKDYCIDPTLTGQSYYEPGDPVPFTKSHRLKIYWEEGYEWQDEKFERECKPSCARYCRNL